MTEDLKILKFKITMEDSPIPSPSLLPMPPLPQCLKKHLLKEHLTEIETNKTLKSLIQPEYERSLKGNDLAKEDNYINMEKYKIVGKQDRYARSETPELDVPKESVGKEMSWKGNIGAAIGHLKNEIKTLRNQDVSLLCQLCTLNESIQEYKSLMQERMLDSYSECSSLYSMDFTIDESEVDNQSFMSRNDSESRSYPRVETDNRPTRCEPSFRNFTNKMEGRVYSYKSDLSRSVFPRNEMDPRSPFSVKPGKPDSISYTYNKTFSDTVSTSSSMSYSSSSSKTEYDYALRPNEQEQEPMYLEPKSEPYYANITTSKVANSVSQGRKSCWPKNKHKSGEEMDEPIYQNIQHETSC